MFLPSPVTTAMDSDQKNKTSGEKEIPPKGVLVHPNTLEKSRTTAPPHQNYFTEVIQASVEDPPRCPGEHKKHTKTHICFPIFR